MNDANTGNFGAGAGRSNASTQTDDISGAKRESLCAEFEAYIAAKPLRAIIVALMSGILVGRLIL